MNVISDEVQFVTVAYIPVVRKLKEPGADEKARRRRSAVLQRVLYLAFRTAIGASHSGEPVTVGDRILLAFPRLLLYLADLPEEKAILCMKSGQCARPCSSCDVRVNLTGLPAALDARDRDVFHMLTAHLEANGHREHQREGRRRAHLEAMTSAQSALPALAGFAGLSTAPFLLYKMVGFDILHVCSLYLSGEGTGERRVGLTSFDCPCVAPGGALLWRPPDLRTTNFFSVLPVPDMPHLMVLSHQVLDLGVTRLLVHRLVRVFAHLSKTHYLLCGTLAVTCRIGNVRISFMGRRSTAPGLAPGYVCVSLLSCT